MPGHEEARHRGIGAVGQDGPFRENRLEVRVREALALGPVQEPIVNFHVAAHEPDRLVVGYGVPCRVEERSSHHVGSGAELRMAVPVELHEPFPARGILDLESRARAAVLRVGDRPGLLGQER